MASAKDTFEPHTFRAHTFAAGVWRGVGEDQAATLTGAWVNVARVYGGHERIAVQGGNERVAVMGSGERQEVYG